MLTKSIFFFWYTSPSAEQMKKNFLMLNVRRGKLIEKLIKSNINSNNNTVK